MTKLISLVVVVTIVAITITVTATIINHLHDHHDRLDGHL